MRIDELLGPEEIVLLPEIDTKESLINLVLDRLAESTKGPDPKDDAWSEYRRLVFERENQASTGMGGGVAFPHARVEGLREPLIAIAVLGKGVEFDSPDKRPVRLAVLFLFPADRGELGVKIQGLFAGFLMADANMNAMLTAETPEDIHNLLKSAEMRLDTHITALDLMRPPKIKLSMDTKLQEATRLMREHNTEVATLVDEDDKVLGKIDCIHLFQRELPDYFKDLKSVPPIHDSTVFRNYFSDASRLTVGDVFDENVAKLAPDASLIEVLFLLTVEKHSIVHVCEDDKLVGVIDRITVLDKVFNL